MLGHAELSTTQIYTQATIRALKAIHTATHPGAVNGPHRTEPADPERADAAEELLDALDTEAAQEHDDEHEPIDLPVDDQRRLADDLADHLADGQSGHPADGPGHDQGPSERPDGA